MLNDLLGLDINDNNPKGNPQDQKFMQAVRAALALQGGMNGMQPPNLIRDLAP